MEDIADWLATLPFPRPFTWKPFVYGRRALYGVVSLFMLVGCVGFPLWHGLTQSRGYEPVSRLMSYQVYVFFGALIVVAFIRISYTASKLFDDCKWLAKFGAVGEANLLWVLGNERTALVTYRFWDLQGRERQREALITAENGAVLPPLQAGDVATVLFDPHKPDSRNLLWTEVARFIQLTPAARRTAIDAASTSSVAG